MEKKQPISEEAPRRGAVERKADGRNETKSNATGARREERRKESWINSNNSADAEGGGEPTVQQLLTTDSSFDEKKKGKRHLSVVKM
ncbi:hypothetical protein TNCV_1096121 [Trichonephila clavipes]|nr:hypothetical protein TNCV_1096121 [Trichonephila clavipes]